MNRAAEKLKRILVERGGTIAVAESLTCGHLQAAIASASGASNYFAGGVTAYNVDQKVGLLGVNREHANSVNCVSEHVAREMAVGVCQLFGADIGVSTTGYAEPWPDGGVEQPFAFFAICIDGRVQSGIVDVTHRSRVETQIFVAEQVMKQLVESVESESA